MLNIPPRPHLVPAIDENDERITRLLKRSANLAMKDRESEAFILMERAGAIASDAVRRYVITHDFIPLSPKTIEKRKKLRASKRIGEKPLIFTGQYIKSITYEVRKIDAH